MARGGRRSQENQPDRPRNRADSGSDLAMRNDVGEVAGTGGLFSIALGEDAPGR